MGFLKVRFSHYRNLTAEEISLDSREIFLIGENGQGKTNFLEGIYVLCYGASFRTKNERHLIANGQRELVASASFSSQSGFNTIRFGLSAGKKDIRVNETVIRDRKEIIRNLPCIAFTHEDFQFVNGAPEFQRFFFDQTLSLYNPLYIETLRVYRKLLKSRNLLLKQNDPLALEVYETQLVTAGLELIQARQAVIQEFNSEFSALFRAISGHEHDLAVRYLPSWKTTDSQKIRQHLQERRDYDRLMGVTSSGPHRDRYRFEMEQKNFVETASTGQIRLVSLILRSSQARFFQRKTQRLPILLLDDVLLELDGERRKRFLEHLPEYEQAFFTFLPEEPVMRYRKPSSLVYSVSQGRLVAHG